MGTFAPPCVWHLRVSSLPWGWLWWGGGAWRLGATAGLLYSHSKWVSMVRQTSDVVTENSEAGGPSEVQHILELWTLWFSDSWRGLLWHNRRAGGSEILGELLKQVRAWRKSRTTKQAARRARLAATSFTLLILKSSISRIRGSEHVAWLRTAESMLGPERIAERWG